MTYGSYALPPDSGVDVIIRQQCIGIKSNGTRCSEIATKNPPYPEHPTWPYLCSYCANESPRKGSANSTGIVMERSKTGII